MAWTCVARGQFCGNTQCRLVSRWEDGLLFVGALDEEDSPNVDSVCWFVRQVLPKLRSLLSADVAVDLVGATSLPAVWNLAGRACPRLGG